MPERRPIKLKVYARAVIAVVLIASWSLLSLSGLLLWLAPAGRQSGQTPLLFDLTKSEWGDIHFWVAVATVTITLLHIIIDWKALRGVIRYLTSAHRNRRIFAE